MCNRQESFTTTTIWRITYGSITINDLFSTVIIQLQISMIHEFSQVKLFFLSVYGRFTNPFFFCSKGIENARRIGDI